MDAVRKHLDSVRPAGRVEVSTAHVRALVDSLVAVTPLPEVLDTELFNGWEALDAVDVVETLGKFIARSAKSRFRGEVHTRDHDLALVPLTEDQLRHKWGEVQAAYKRVKAAEAAVKAAQKESTSDALPKARKRKVADKQTPLFAAAPPSVRQRTALEKADSELRTAKSQLTKAGRSIMPYAGEDGLAFIAEGWRPEDLGRNITQSVATCVISELNDETLDRFVARTYAPRNVTLTEDHVLLLVWMCHNNLCERLLELGPEQYDLTRVLSQAWDLIEVYCADAKKAVQDLVYQSTQPEIDVEAVRKAVLRGQWLNPGEFARVSSAIPTSGANTAVLARRLRGFAAVVNSAPEWLSPSDPYQVTSAQAQAICRVAGLSSDAAEELEVTREIRAHLTELGLRSDLDREVSEGVRAWRSGLLDEFYLNRADRVSGDPDWSRRWQEVLATA